MRRRIERPQTRPARRLDARHRHFAHFLSGTRKPQKRADPLGIGFHVADGTALPFADTAFDFMTAFMSLMDVPDQARVLQEVQRVLRPTGLLQFSIVHPRFVPVLRKALRDANGNVRGIGIGGYFDTIDGPESRYRATSCWDNDIFDVTKPSSTGRGRATCQALRCG
jgi:SAM-dependent methyltransferase